MVISMNKIAIVYWSGTGNTEAMAGHIAEGVRAAGGEVKLFSPGEFSAEQLASFDAVAFGCPAMGNEVLEEGEFEPMFSALEDSLSGKQIALFGSYGWGTDCGCGTGAPAVPQLEPAFWMKMDSPSMKPRMRQAKMPAKN